MNKAYNNLKFRHELKFMINRHQYFIIRQRLKNLVRPDKYASTNGEYHIRSLYFDDYENSALSEKLGGFRDRHKYRIRVYNGSDRLILFEKKIKCGDYIAKLKKPLDRDMYDAILNGNYEVLHQPDNPFAMELYLEMKQHLLRPRVIVDYVREPYVCENGNVRITFDKELRTGLHATDLFDQSFNPVPALDDRHIIMEVKYDEYLPEYIKAAVQMEGLHQQAASKYVICCKYLKNNNWEDQ